VISLMDGAAPLNAVYMAAWTQAYVIKASAIWTGRKADMCWHHASAGEVWSGA